MVGERMLAVSHTQGRGLCGKVVVAQLGVLLPSKACAEDGLGDDKHGATGGGRRSQGERWLHSSRYMSSLERMMSRVLKTREGMGLRTGARGVAGDATGWVAESFGVTDDKVLRLRAIVSL